MENDRQRPVDDESLESFTQPGTPREVALRKRWGPVVSRRVLHQSFELLSQQPYRQMYISEIAKTLNTDRSWVAQEIHHLEWARVVEVERRSNRTYYRLRPGMAEQFQQWLNSQKPDEPQQ